MRAAFVRTLTALADRDPRVVLLTGDLGFMALEPFSERHPSRFFNVGVAEQNMVGIATGLAEAGFIPYVYSIVTFATLRAYEFIRNGPVRHDLPVRVVGMGGGFEYGPAGATHHGLEDVAVMRALPGMWVFAPADHEQAASVLEAVHGLDVPLYLRLGKDDRTTVPGLGGRFEVGRAQLVRDGNDVCFVAMGPLAAQAVAAAEAVGGGVAVVASVRPEPREDIEGLASRFDVLVTAEAHSISGGIGSLVAEVVAESGVACRVVRCGVRTPTRTGGSERFLLHRHGLDAAGLAETARAALERAAT